MKRRNDWDALLAYAMGLSGGSDLKACYGHLQQAFADGTFTGRCPDYTTFWRHVRAGESTRPHAATQLVAGGTDVGAGQPLGGTPRAHLQQPAPSSVTNVQANADKPAIHPPQPAEPAPESIDQELKAGTRALMEVMAPLLAHCPQLLDPNTTRDYRRLLKRIKTLRRAPRLSATELERADEFAEQWRTNRLNMIQLLQRTIDRYRPVLALAREHGLLPTYAEAEQEVKSHAPADGAAGTPPPVAPFTYAAPGEWGKLASTTVRPAYRSIVAQDASSHTRRRAMLRVQVIQPVLRQLVSPTEAVAALDRYCRKQQTAADEVLFGSLDLEVLRNGKRISVRTIRRWAHRCREVLAASHAVGQVAPPLVHVLEHRLNDLTRLPRKRTPEVERLVLETYKGQGGEHLLLSGAAVARHLRLTNQANISARTVQLILQEKLSDVDRALSRGGPAASDVIFRSNLMQSAARPNQCWIMDHSFIKLEHIDPEHPEYLDAVKEYEELPFPYRVEYRNHQGIRRVERKEGVWATVIIDACTRRLLALRLWEKPPTTLLTLSVVYDAALEFGLPDILYTDNGGDFRSKEIRQLLTAAGIKQVFSMPWTPEGRGAVERWFRTLKEQIMPYVCGYVGGRGNTYRAATEDLLTLPELNERVWELVNLLYNHAVHSATRQKPAEHYEHLVGSHGFTDARLEDLVQLLPVASVKRVPAGVVFRGVPYWCPQFNYVPEGSSVNLHHHAVRWKTVLVSVQNSEGDAEFVGVAEYYDAEHPAPGIAERRRLEAAATNMFRDNDLARIGAEAERLRTNATRVAAEEMTQALLSAVASDVESLQAAPPQARLASGAHTPAEGQRLPTPSRPSSGHREPLPRQSSRPSGPRTGGAEILVNPFA